MSFTGSGIAHADGFDDTPASWLVTPRRWNQLRLPDIDFDNNSGRSRPRRRHNHGVVWDWSGRSSFPTPATEAHLKAISRETVGRRFLPLICSGVLRAPENRESLGAARTQLGFRRYFRKLSLTSISLFAQGWRRDCRAAIFAAALYRLAAKLAALQWGRVYSDQINGQPPD
jgi:hypothetical protein